MKEYAQKLPDLEESKKKKRDDSDDKRKGHDDFEQLEKKVGARKSKRVRKISDDDYDEDD